MRLHITSVEPTTYLALIHPHHLRNFLLRPSLVILLAKVACDGLLFLQQFTPLIRGKVATQVLRAGAGGHVSESPNVIRSRAVEQIDYAE